MIQKEVILDMQDMRALTSAAILEMFWETRRKDMIDLISPFVLYAVAHTTSPDEEINIAAVSEYVKKEFGYNEFPGSIVTKVLNRHTHDYFKRANGQYKLSVALDDIVEGLESKREKCQEHIDDISALLAIYLEEHCKKKKKFKVEEAEYHLETFFARYGLYLGTEPVYLETIAPNKYEIDYYIAQFIFELERDSNKEYSYITSLVRGFFLSTAIYLQPENGNILSSSYKDTAFYYDTPFLIRLLGYQSKQEQDAAKELHTMLKRQGGRFYYFPQTEKEIQSILTAYQHAISTGSAQSLEGLDRQGYSASSIERLKNTFSVKLEMPEYDIHLAQLPGYPQDKDGTVDFQAVLPEREIQEYVREQVGHYKQDSLDADIMSFSAIDRLRYREPVQDIEKCRAIFVTTNVDFARAVNKYYKENIMSNTLPLVITDADLAAIAWVKCNTFDSDIPKKQLLANAYMAMQPPPEIIEKLKIVVNQLRNEGVISNEEARVIRTSHFIQKELNIMAMGDPNKVNVASVSEVQNQYKKHLTKDLAAKHSAVLSETRQKQIATSIEKAHEYAAHRKNIFTKLGRIILGGISISLFAICACSIYQDQLRTLNFSSQLIITSIVAIFSLFSFYDTVISRKLWAERWIQKAANKFETKVYEKKKKEYFLLIPIQDEELSDMPTIE